MRNLRRLYRRLVGRPRLFEHLTDAQLLDVLERARRGEDTADVAPFPGDPSTWPPTGFERVSDEELLRQLDEEAAAVRERML